MNLKNPNFRTSFYITRYDDKVYVSHLEVICEYCDYLDKFFYQIGLLGSRNLTLGKCFDTPEEAFNYADRICSAYPPFPLVEYPEFCEEDFENEH